MSEELDLPRYRLIQPLYADDMYIGAEQEIIYRGTPNEAMEPLNESARQKMEAFLRTLGPLRKTPDVGDQMEDAMRNRPRELDFPKLDKEIPLTGTVRPDGQRATGPEKAKSVEILPEPVGGRFRRPIKVMGTIIQETPSVGSIEG